MTDPLDRFRQLEQERNQDKALDPTEAPLQAFFLGRGKYVLLLVAVPFAIMWVGWKLKGGKEPLEAHFEQIQTYCEPEMRDSCVRDVMRHDAACHDVASPYISARSHSRKGYWDYYEECMDERLGDFSARVVLDPLPLAHMR